ncbi:hypothetical protein EIK76_00810 [Rheinheimera mesophila]|uniref:DUF58 domain-containing protein n=1 Tax=Rheinheimera mesophila TaxID=1547515 RepID=A0A3P3QP22_9GAMM|nr:hypothetical protein [Rheinheimera mesophila]RRJ22658.1 hypothetical protein EIK76_00810 [Rheinheimera mesophila]
MMLAKTLWQPLFNQFRRYFYRWLETRQPAAATVELRQHILFVFPTAYGGWFVLLIILLYLFGANYQNNLILLCAYLLLALFCCCILAAFFNLHQLRLTATSEPFGYPDSAPLVTITLSQHDNKKMFSLSGPDFAPVFFDTLPAALQLVVYPKSRGLHQLGRFTLSSCYPFGLIRCWSHIQLKQSYWIYPQPALPAMSAASAANSADYPDQLVPYQSGAPVSAMDWKRLAKNPWQPVIRRYTSYARLDTPEHLVVTATGSALEQQLAQFCGLLLQFEQQGQSYGLSTPKTQISPSRGQAHLHRCLQTLALC